MDAACRPLAFLIAAAAGAMLHTPPAAAVDPLDPSRPCSVFDAGPCTPSFCGVYGSWPCVTETPHYGQNLRLTIYSRGVDAGRSPEGEVRSIRDLYAALRACWEPPPLERAFRGMEMSVRFAFKRTGEPVAAPRVTYTTSEADSAARRVYREAIDAALARCNPMPFSKTMGGGVAGRPIAIRYVDDREANHN
jgi:hypothetical protein